MGPALDRDTLILRAGSGRLKPGHGPSPPGPAREKFLSDWAHDDYKNSPAVFNDVLGKVLTLSTALTGGGLALLDKAVMPGWAKVGVLLLFLAGTVLCLIGLFPTGGPLVLNPDVIRNRADLLIRRKRTYLLAASLTLVGGLLAAILAAATH